MGLYLGIFLVTLSGLMFEIGLTRIFSATIWYHFAFVAISVALLGWGLGGFALHLLRGRVTLSRERAALFTFLYGLSIPLALWLIVRVPFHPDRLAFYFGVSLVPFFLAGIALSMLFAVGREIAGRLYFADLLGASLGALAVTFLLSWLGGETAILAVSLAPLAAAALFAPRFRVSSAVAALLVLAAVGVNERTGLFKIRSAPTKGLYRHMAATPGSKIALTGWNAYSRIDAVTGFESPYLARLYIDSDAWTNILEWDGNVASVADMREWYRALPFKVAPEKPKTLIIGPGGGSDVLVALAAGSEKVTAVEMNPLMLRFVRHFGARAGNLYDHPQVEAILSEGRTFIRRADRSFDVILMGFVDSWAAVASGGLSLSENHLYTVEAFQAYLDHLTPDGELVILRWDVDVPRLVSNAVALLGPEEAGRRVAVLLEKRQGDREDPPQMIFMLKKRPWSTEETERMSSWPGVEPVIVPGRHVEEPYASLFSGKTSFADYVAQAKTRIDPVFDDRPFFFARAKPWGLPGAMKRAFLWILVPVLAALRALPGLRQAERRARGPLRRLGRVLREPGRRVHCRGAVAAAAPDAASRPPDLHPLDPALHAAGLRRPRQHVERALPAGAGVPRRRRPRRRLRARASAGGAAAPAAAARRSDRGRHPGRGPARLLHGDAVPARAAGHRPGAVPAAALLLGVERHLQRGRIDGHDGGRRRLRLHLGDAGRGDVLPRGGPRLAGVLAGVGSRRLSPAQAESFSSSQTLMSDW